MACIEDAADDGHQIRTGGCELAGIVRGDAADRHPWHRRQRDITQQRLARKRRVGLGRRGEERAERDVACACGDGCLRASDIVVTRSAENRVRSQRRARLAEGAVVAAEMGTVGARIGGQLPVVVDDQRHTRRPAQRQQRVHLCAALRGIGALVAVLQPRRLRQHRRDACQQACGVDLVGREQIQAAWRGGTGIHRRGFRWRERDGTMRHHLHAARPIIR